MNIEDFRNYCLSLKGATDRMPFTKATSDFDRDLLVFSVGGKWFCFVNIDEFSFCNMKCDPAQITDLQERYDGIRPGWHMNKKHWISVYFNSDVPDSLIRQLVRQSYDIVVASLPKRVRDGL